MFSTTTLFSILYTLSLSISKSINSTTESESINSVKIKQSIPDQSTVKHSGPAAHSIHYSVITTTMHRPRCRGPRINGPIVWIKHLSGSIRVNQWFNINQDQSTASIRVSISIKHQSTVQSQSRSKVSIRIRVNQHILDRTLAVYTRMVEGLTATKESCYTGSIQSL